MKKLVLHDVDSRIPNLALMRLSTFYRQQGSTECRPTERNESRRVFPGGSAEGAPDLIWKMRPSRETPNF